MVTQVIRARMMATVAALAVALPLAPAAMQSGGPAYTERDFLSRVRRLTVEGRRAGEGYWSPDGSRIVFQSEREPGNPFYQIYTLDLAALALAVPLLVAAAAAAWRDRTAD